MAQQATSQRDQRSAARRRWPWKNPSYRSIVAFFCVIVVLLVSACTVPFASPTVEQGTPSISPVVGDTPTSAVSPTAQATTSEAVINYQAIGCPSSVAALNWNNLVGARSGVDKVQKVTCAPLENGGLAAVVNVRYYANGRLDFYIYDNLFGTPVRRFNVQNLAQGNTEISPEDTVMTAENPNNDPFGVDVFKEYQWNGAGYSQILFPGIFPDMTHYQAEQDQANVNVQLAQTTATPTAQHSTWQTSAFGVVNRMAQDLFDWSTGSGNDSTITYNSRDGIYIVQVLSGLPGGGGFIATLFRLDNVATNIFEVKQVTTLNGTLLTMSSPASGVQVGSPVHTSGAYSSSGTLLGRTVVYSDTYVKLGDSGGVHGSAPTGYATFAPSASFHLSTGGLQEGLVAFYVTNQNNISVINGVVLAKVFLAA
jgi:hypothetical protein